MGVFDSLIAPAIGVLLANAMFFSPTPAVLKAREDQILGELNPLPYPIISANCIGWCIYSILTQNIFLLLGNLPGALIGIFFTLTSIVLTNQKTRDLISFLCIFFPFIFILELFVLSMIETSGETVLFVQGLINNIILIIYYAAPLSVFRKVIVNRDSSSLYFPLVIANTLNGCMWFIYGLISLQDPFIWVGNGIGVMLSIFSNFLIIIFPKKEKKQNFFVRLVSSRSLSSLQSFRGDSEKDFSSCEGAKGNQRISGKVNDKSDGVV